MARWKKKLARMKENSRGWRYGELVTILYRKGFEESSRAGSHVTWKHPSGERVTIVDSGSGTLHPAAVEEVLAALERIEEGG